MNYYMCVGCECYKHHGSKNISLNHKGAYIAGDAKLLDHAQKVLKEFYTKVPQQTLMIEVKTDWKKVTTAKVILHQSDTSCNVTHLVIEC